MDQNPINGGRDDQPPFHGGDNIVDGTQSNGYYQKMTEDFQPMHGDFQTKNGDFHHIDKHDLEHRQGGSDDEFIKIDDNRSDKRYCPSCCSAMCTNACCHCFGSLIFEVCGLFLRFF